MVNTEPPLVSFTGLRKRFGTKTLFEISQFTIPAGINRLIGKNGAGKTTLLRIVAGLSTFEGEIVLFGDLDIRKDKLKHRRSVNFSESEPAFPEKARGKDLLNIYAKSHGISVSDSKELIDRFQMANYLTDQIRTYSAGMRKKLSLLLAFVGSPKLILLDEPFITIDQKAQKELKAIILQRADQGENFIISTHGDLHGPTFEDKPIFEVENHQIKLISGNSNGPDSPSC